MKKDGIAPNNVYKIFDRPEVCGRLKTAFDHWGEGKKDNY